MSVESVTPREISQTIPLLKEYTQKLNSSVEGWMILERRIQRARIIVILTVSVSGMFLLGFYNLLNDFSLGNFLVMPSLIVLLCLVVYWWVATETQHSKELHHIRMIQLAFSLESLVRTISQYYEHASQRLDQRFELDLRLAEAESAVKAFSLIDRN